MSAADPNAVRLCHSLTASEWQIFTNIRFPSALPFIFSGMKIGITLSNIGVIIGEFITSQQGLGYLIIFATSRADTVVAMAAIVVLCASGLLLYGAVALAEKVTDRRYGVRRAIDVYGDESKWDSLHEHYPGQRAASAGEIADLMLFLCSPRAGYMSGAIVTIDGGIAAKGSIIKQRFELK